MDRRVTGTKRDRHGNIVALCNSGESWSPRGAADVARDIKSNKKSYYVKEAGRSSYVRVVAGNALESTNDPSSKNGLDKLPVC